MDIGQPTLDQLRIVLLLTPLIMIGAMGQMLVLVARHVDLSIGSTLGFSAMVSGMMYRFVEGVPWWTGIPLSVAVGAGLGLVNGLVITLFRLPAIIVTLGTLSLYRGLTFIISNAKQIGLAAHNFHDTNNTLPPAWIGNNTLDPDGWATWAVLLLPHVEQQAQYALWDLQHPASRQTPAAYQNQVKTYHCPGRPSASVMRVQAGPPKTLGQSVGGRLPSGPVPSRKM